MAKIMENIANVASAMSADPGEADRIRNESVEAILKGMGDPAWEKYMSNFGSGTQLNRLIGKDTEFNKPENYGHTILAYIVAAGPCTSYTGFLRMATDMPYHMAIRLDEGVTEAVPPPADGGDSPADGDSQPAVA